MNQNYILKGHVCYSTDQNTLEVKTDHYLVCRQGICEGVFPEIPSLYKDFPVTDYKDRLIIPGLVDLHVHAPQYGFRGLGMDLELLDWLEVHTFPEEARFSDPVYAQKAYSIFADSLAASATTRACIFGTIHVESTLLLMDLMEQTGVVSFVGKVNMDRNAPENLREASARDSAAATWEWLEQVKKRGYRRTRPVLTPRFTPSCTDELMKELGRIQAQTGLPVQSHLSENQGEGAWVRELCPWAEVYAETYQKAGLLGGGCPSVMAHCVYSGSRELKILKEEGVFIAHCPESNSNLASGAAPVRRFLEEGIPTGLGSDIAGGSTENMFHAMAQAIQVSKLRWRLLDDALKPLTVEEAFYLATKEGGAFWGKAGSFEPGYEFDAVVLDEGRLRYPGELDVKQRLERMIYLADEREVYAKYVQGACVRRKSGS